MVIDFRVLGPLQVCHGGEPIDLRAPMQRRLLAALLSGSGRSLSVAALVEELWPDQEPAKARRSLHVHVHRLREILGDTNVIRYDPDGYSIAVTPTELDALHFVALADRGSASGIPPHEASRLLRQALGLWRGPAYAGVSSGALVADEARRLDDRRVRVHEHVIAAELDLGRHADLIGELTDLTRQHPYRESLCAQLMLALYRSGRQSDALEVFREARVLLVDHLGVEPGPQLQRLHEAVLRADEELLPTGPPTTVRATPPAIRELPPDVTGFTGRAEAIAALDMTLSVGPATAPAPVVITAIAGMAGVGKTALAVHWAHRVAHRFPDGQLFLNLRGYASELPVRPAAALAQFLRSLGIPAERVPMELDDAVALYRSLLAERRMLIVLDNARSVEQVRPLLPASPGCLVLATSRDRLSGLVARDGAHRISLEVLPPDEARTLLARVLGDGRTADEPVAVAALAEACAYLPLALRIAAANLADHPHRTVQEHVRRLRTGDRLGEIEVDGDEQAAVRAAFDLSYMSVSEPARRLFRLLGLVPGADVTATAAGALAGTTAELAERLLDQLGAAHLVEQRPDGRFGLHDLLRSYATEQVEANEREPDRLAAVERLLTWYLQKADGAARTLNPRRLMLPLPSDVAPGTAFPSAAAALAWLDAERHNLVAAVRSGAQHGLRRVPWLLADRLRDYLDRSRQVADWLTVARCGLVSARADQDLAGQAAALHSLAHARYCLGRWPHAITLLTRAHRLAEACGWTRGLAGINGTLGVIHHLCGHRADALHHLHKGLAICRTSGHPGAPAYMLNTLAQISLEWARPAEAVEFATQAIAASKEVGGAGEPSAIDTLGNAYHMLGELDLAAHHASRALAMSEASGNRHQRVWHLTSLAGVHRDADRLAIALEHGRAAVALAVDINDRYAEAAASTVLASIQDRLADHSTALTGFQRAADLATQVGVVYWAIAAQAGLAAAYHHVGDLARAAVHARHTADEAGRLEFRLLEAQALIVLAEIHIGQCDPATARRHAARAAEINRQAGCRLGTARALLVLAEAIRRTGDTDIADELRQSAHDLYAEVDVPLPQPAS